MKNSPISKITLEGREFFVKRDDLIDPYLAGNKYRKLYTLLQTPKENIDKIISYGGTQSNAMLAIAAICKQKDWEFIYYTKPVSKRITELTYGNYSDALYLGMKNIELEDELYGEMIGSLRLNLDSRSYIIDQGGADDTAQEGLKVLALEIREQLQCSKEYESIKAIATPSGTGTTALFLAKSLPEFKVYTTPCVGDEIYLREQMQALSEIPDNLIILKPKKKYHFSKPYLEFYGVYLKLQKSGVVFDLLYAPSMWEALLEQTSEPTLYVHSGGVSGNTSMLKRYERKFNL
ncbi:MAG: pyridoxal-phosphate dependent enzyme [Campylobacterota bacterium]|nr:pyridoxal-phosphate dependent enzyme [Campylobacterota bacterium]